jgi:hypothetical protein
MNNSFNMNRLLLYMRRQAVMNMPSILVAAGAVFGSLLLISVLVGRYYPHNIAGLVPLFFFCYTLCGLILASKMFSELHTPQKAYSYLTLPVSTSEKLLGSWLLSSPVFSAVFLGIALLLFTIACALAGKMELAGEMFGREARVSVMKFLIFQTVFFLGAVYFRNNNFLKTLLTLFLFSVAIGIYIAIMSWLLLDGTYFNVAHPQLAELVQNAGRIIELAYWTLLGPFMLVTAYFRLKERQV